MGAFMDSLGGIKTLSVCLSVCLFVCRLLRRISGQNEREYSCPDLRTGRNRSDRSLRFRGSRGMLSQVRARTALTCPQVAGMVQEKRDKRQREGSGFSGWNSRERE